MRVLVVDDKVETQGALEMYLRMCGCWTDKVGSAEAALKRLHISVPDAIVVDYLMPGMNGIDFIDEIRQESKTATVPVALVSGLPEADIGPLKAITAGLEKVSFFHKPFSPSVLVKWLKEVTGRLSDAPLPGDA